MYMYILARNQAELAELFIFCVLFSLAEHAAISFKKRSCLSACVITHVFNK